MRWLSWLFIAAALALPVGGAAAAPTPETITGTVRLLGCKSVDPTALQVVAEPMAVTLVGGGRSSGAGGARRLARVEAADRRGTLAFSIRGLEPDGAYRLGIDYPSDVCGGKVFWRGPFEGLAVPGAEPVEIDGITARTEIAVLAHGTDEWLGADDFGLGSPGGGHSRLRWRSSVPGVVGGELQVAIDSYPTEDFSHPCAEPPGAVVYRKDVAGGDSWTGLGVVDFNAILSPRRATDDGMRGDLRTYRSLVAGRPVFVRVVPRTAAGPACDVTDAGVSGWALLDNVSGETLVGGAPSVASKIAPGDGNEYFPPYTADRPTYDELGFKVIKDHTLPAMKCIGLMESTLKDDDPIGCEIVNAGWRDPGTVLEKGAWLYYTPSSSGGGGGGLNPLSYFTNTVMNLATAGWNAVGFGLEQAHQLYEEVKQAVADVVVDVIHTLPGGDVLCDAIKKTPTSCDQLVQTGIAVALTSVGMPPSIPSWEELKKKGAEYVTAELAEEIANESNGVLPAEVTQPMLQKVAEAALDKMTAKRGGDDPKYNWVIPYAGFEPSTMLVSVQKPNASEVPPDNLVVGWPKTPLFAGGHIDVPRLFPDDGELKIPIVLRPNLEAFNAPICFWALHQGINCVPGASPGAEPVCFASSAGVPDAPPGLFFLYGCTYTNWPQIYYRDRWVSERLDAVGGCTPIAAIASQWSVVGGGSNDPFDLEVVYSAPPLDWRFATFAAVKPRVHAVWNGPTYSAC